MSERESAKRWGDQQTVDEAKRDMALLSTLIESLKSLDGILEWRFHAAHKETLARIERLGKLDGNEKMH